VKTSQGALEKAKDVDTLRADAKMAHAMAMADLKFQREQLNFDREVKRKQSQDDRVKSSSAPNVPSSWNSLEGSVMGKRRPRRAEESNRKRQEDECSRKETCAFTRHSEHESDHDVQRRTTSQAWS